MAKEAASAEGRAAGGWVDPYRAYNFKLDIQGVTQGHFTGCSGLGVRVSALRYREGGSANMVHRLPGPVEYADAVLRYGLTESQDLWNWFMTAVQGRVERRNVSIVLLDSDAATEVTRWNLFNTWPAEWRGAPLDALGREVAIETLTLVYETLERG